MMAYGYGYGYNGGGWSPDYYGGSYPAPAPAPAQPQQSEQVLLVADEMEARAQRIPYNTSLMMMDKGKGVIYIKKVDASGQPDFRAYSLVPMPNTPQASDIVSRAEFVELSQMVQRLAAIVTPSTAPQEVTPDGQPTA